MQPLKKKGVIIFLENFVLPYHKGISHFAKLTYAQKNFLNPSAPKSEDNSKQPSSQPPVQNIQSIGVGSSLLQYNNGRGFQEPQIFSDMTGGVQVQNYNVQPGLQPDVQSEYQLKQAFIQSQQQDQQVRKQVQDDFDSDRITFDYPKFDVIGVINKQISNRQKQPYSAERYYYNVGTKINLLQSEKEFMKYKISPKNLTPFVKLKKIQNNEYSRKLKNNKSIPLKLNNTYRPYDSLSAEELDFIVYDGVKLFMCEYEEIRMSKESFQYVLDNYSQIEQVVDTIIQRINMESTPAESSEIMENLEYSSEDKLLLEQKFYQEKMNDPAFQQEYERVKYLYKKVFEIFNHIDQKFFFRSRSVEWSDKKYQFIHGNIKQQLQLIQNLGRSLKFWGDEN